MKSLLAWMKGNVGSIECYMEFFCLKFHPIHQEFMVSLQTFLFYALNNMLECMVKVQSMCLKYVWYSKEGRRSTKLFMLDQSNISGIFNNTFMKIIIEAV